MDVAENLGMTVSELHTRMSASEFDLWIARAMIKNEACPQCGVAPTEMMHYEKVTRHCPVCANDYFITRAIGSRTSWRSSVQDTESEDLQAAM